MSFSKVTNSLNPFSRILEPFRVTANGKKIDYEDVICAAFIGDESTVRRGLHDLDLSVTPKTSYLFDLLCEKGFLKKNDSYPPIGVNNPLVAACLGEQKRIVNVILEDENGIQLLQLKTDRDRSPLESFALSKIDDAELFQRLLDTAGPIELSSRVAHFGKPEIIKKILQQPNKIAQIVNQTLFHILDANSSSIVIAYCDQPSLPYDVLEAALAAGAEDGTIEKDVETIELLLQHGADPRKMTRPLLTAPCNIVNFAKSKGHSKEIIMKLESAARKLNESEAKQKIDSEVDEKASEDLWADL